MRSRFLASLVVTVGALAVTASAGAQTTSAYQAAVTKYGEPESLYRTGQYASLVTVINTLPKTDSSWISMQPMFIRSLTTLGRYDEAERAGREAITTRGGENVLNTLGESVLQRGKRAAAESLFLRAMSSRADDSLTAKLNLAILTYNRGAQDSALHMFDHFIDAY